MELRPRLRPDLEAFHQQEADGSPVVILKDPIGGRFFRVTPQSSTDVHGVSRGIVACTT